MNPQTCELGIGCPAAIFALAALPGRLLKVMPPPVWAFLAGTLVGTLILKFGKQNLINVPDSLAHGIVLPDFGAAITMPHCCCPSPTWLSPWF